MSLAKVEKGDETKMIKSPDVALCQFRENRTKKNVSLKIRMS